MNGSCELVTFRGGDLEYCIDIRHVREIRSWTPATPIPGAPADMIGVINLRGTVVPVMDLGMRLGRAKSDASARHAIIVVEMGEQLHGLLVEGVSDIISAGEAMIHRVPDMSSADSQACVHGIVTLDDRLISLLSLENVLPKQGLKAA